MKWFRRSLFLRIFLWFWMTVILTGIAIVLTFIMQHGSIPTRWNSSLISTARYSGVIAVAQMDQGGAPAVSAYIDDLAREGHLQACLFDASGTAIAGAQCASFQEMAHGVVSGTAPIMRMRFGIVRAAMSLTGSDGRHYIFATDLPAGPRAAVGANRAFFILEWGVALFVSGCVCYLLTRYITAPILRLREASQQLAAGHLTSRAAPQMQYRRDELGELVDDFNAMADRIEQLVLGQRQLISDISHELRSPLARLNVALDLVREKKSSDLAVDHMERDLACMNEMIERLLTIARLDAPSAPVQFSPVNLRELISELIQDAEFESRRRDIQITLIAEQDYWVQGNPQLLHSVVENVVRNAIHYTNDGTSVEVRIESEAATGVPFVQLIVRDHGPGVPAAERVNIFRPFYRVTESRDRQSGGAGLGLAIADRIVRFHHGTIRAEGAIPQGLQVIIRLPELDPQHESAPSNIDLS
jgi:two-component system, OmpR family, sensor histidine kinase CpxA